MSLPRRQFLMGVAALAAAPAVAKATALLPTEMPFTWQGVDLVFDETVNEPLWGYRVRYHEDGSTTCEYIYRRDVFVAEESWQWSTLEIVSAT